MPACARCGKQFSGFSFGSSAPTECRECRRTRQQMGAAEFNSPAGTKPTDLAPAQSVGRPVVTLTLIAINVMVYLAMGLSGASWTEPSLQHALLWGADFGPLSLNNEPWRLITSMFVHFGIIHIAFNMWCLFDLGRSLEFITGRRAFAVTYVASGLAASLTSLAWRPWRVGAGASGAIFGVAGAFAAYLYFRRVSFNPGTIRQTKKSLAIFIFYNLIRGAASFGIDNSAHLGGLVAGFILGCLIPPTVRSPTEIGDMTGQAAANPFPLGGFQPVGETKENRVVMTAALASLVVLGIGFAALSSKNADVVNYGRAVQLVRSGHTDQAIVKLQQLVQHNANLEFAQLLLAQLFLDQNNPGGAIGPLEQAAYLDPNYAEVSHNLALAYVGKGRAADAEKLIGAVFRDEKNSPWAAEYIRALAEGESSNYASAVADLHAVVQTYPDWSEAKTTLEHYEKLQRQVANAHTANHTSLPSPGVSAKAAGEPAFAIPYSKLVMKSRNWPLFP
jgi:rhomboid protease GluP